MDDITSLQIRIRYLEVQQAERALNGLDDQAKSTTKGISGLAGAMALATTAAVGLNKVVQTTRQYQVLRANLETATGSMENMEKAWEALIDFASSTPFSLDQTVSAFTKLVNYGLSPSERALKSYGDTAAATGKDFDMLVEAVADAVNGEFERTKNAFNVKAKNMGDTIAFRFRNITTTVKNNAQEIEEYFIKLGENNFAGGMAKRMATLDGAISNLGDSWEQLMFSIGESGLGDFVEQEIRDITQYLQDLKDWIDSGAMEKSLDTWGKAFEGTFDDIKWGIDTTMEGFAFLVDFMQTELSDAAGPLEEDGVRPWKSILEFVQALPAAVKAYTQIAAAELQGLVTKLEGAAEKFGAFVTAQNADNAGANSKFAGPGLPGTAKEGFGSLFSESDANSPGLPGWAKQGAVFDGNNAEGVLPALDSAVDAKVQDAEDYINQVFNEAATEYNNTVTEIDTGNSNAESAMDRYKRLAEERAKNKSGDRTAQFKVSGGDDASSSGAKEKKAKESEFDKLRKQLTAEEDLIEESYQKRIDIIEKNTREGSKLQMDLELAATEQWEEAQQKRIDAMMKEPETMREAFELEEKLIQESYDRRKAIILESTETTELEKQALLEKINADYRKKNSKLLETEITTQLNAWGSMFENLEKLGGAYGKKGFEMQKAAAMASATIMGVEAVLAAYKEGNKISVYAGPAFAAVAAAAVGAQIGQIAATEYSGAYATGGMIPAGKWGVVGEAGAEVVRGPAMVSSAQATGDHYGRPYGGGGGSGGNVTVNINNGAGIAAEARETNGPDGRTIEILTRQVETAMNRRLDEGSSPLGRTMEKRYNLRRGA